MTRIASVPTPALLTLFATLAAAAGDGSPRFRADDPLWREPDDLDVEAAPAATALSTASDEIERAFLARAKPPAPPAMNVNTLGEVPDSSWYENRLGVREMSLRELVRGPDDGGGPAPGPWTVIAVGSDRNAPGLTIRDALGEVYVVTVDDAKRPNLESAAQRIATLALHAFGYHVPEVTLASFRREQLRIDPQATVRDRGRRPPRALTAADVARALRGVALRPDGSIRCAVRRRLPGLPLGPRPHHGTRPDDPNDVVPHEHRRELRGYRLFAAWLDHADARGVAALDHLVAVDGRRYVKHFLIVPQRPARRSRHPRFREIGQIEAVAFDPGLWQPEQPNPAFDAMRSSDAFWAARILWRLAPEAVRALVHEGRFDDPAAEAHLADVLLARRLKVLDRYFRAINPLSDFRVERGRLAFHNLGDDLKLAAVEGYDVEWWSFDNDSEARALLAESARFSTPSIAIPRAQRPWLVARIHTASAAERRWAKAVEVFLRRSATGFDVIAIDREE